MASKFDLMVASNQEEVQRWNKQTNMFLWPISH